ncbi:MAG: hypothetical protein AAGG57_10400 [Pseudomonadota bacterium]
MRPAPVATKDTAVGQVLAKFAAGDPSLFELIAEDIDFRIDHFHDEADTSWQHANTRDALMSLVGRLGEEVFPKGTHALGIDCFMLGEGWYLTCFNQQFFYGIRQEDVTSLTYIISHEDNGKLDYFRENVTNIVYEE